VGQFDALSLTRCKEHDHEHLQRKDRPRHRRLARHRPRSCHGPRLSRGPDPRPLRQERRGRRRRGAQIRTAGGRAQAIGADLASREGRADLAHQVRAIVGERLDIVVANADIAKMTSIKDTTAEDFDALFAMNVRAPFFLVQQLLAILREDSSMIFISSLAAHAAVGTPSA
jgi:NAD(P)-dependent dehydrogenase (short-subunit alcohol dehydrogenase family)